MKLDAQGFVVVSPEEDLSYFYAYHWNKVRLTPKDYDEFKAYKDWYDKKIYDEKVMKNRREVRKAYNKKKSRLQISNFLLKVHNFHGVDYNYVGTHSCKGNKGNYRAYVSKDKSSYEQVMYRPSVVPIDAHYITPHIGPDYAKCCSCRKKEASWTFGIDYVCHDCALEKLKSLTLISVSEGEDGGVYYDLPHHCRLGNSSRGGTKHHKNHFTLSLFLDEVWNDYYYFVMETFATPYYNYTCPECKQTFGDFLL